MRILFAEDDPISRSILQAVFSKHGMDVIETMNGLQAWEKMQEPEPPGLLVLDIMMPRLNGIELCRRIRRLETRNPPYIILLTAKTHKDDIVNGLEAGANDYIAKPFDTEELMARVRVGQRVLTMQAELLAEIEERKNAEKHLEMYKNIISLAPDGFALIDQNNKYVITNKAYEQMLGANGELYGGQPGAETGGSRLLQRTKAHYGPKDYPETATNYQILLETPDGQERFLEFILFPYQGTSGHTTGSIVNVRDITEMKKQQEKLQQSREQLHQAEKLASLGTLISCVAHEINNPNSFIMLHTPVLEQVIHAARPLFEEQYAANKDFLVGRMPYSRIRERIPGIIDGIKDGSQRIKQYVSDLRNYTRHEADPEREAVDLRDVAATSIHLSGYLIRQSTDHFRFKKPEWLPAVAGHAQQLSQIIINLIQNACRALTAKSQAIDVNIRHDRPRGLVVLTVRDQGCGIKPEHMDRIFAPFFTTNQAAGGVGLGLVVSRRIAEEHNGGLEIESVPGQGTTASLILPAG